MTYIAYSTTRSQLHRLYSAKLQDCFEWLVEKDVEGSCCDLFEVLFLHVRGENKENNGNLQSGEPVSGPGLESGTCLMRN